MQKQLSPTLLLYIIFGYFLVLIIISLLTSKQNSNQSFFTADKNSPWYLVAFGMIGTTLSGVTFISVPGWVAAKEFSYMQMVFGYLLGYFIIATVLMPMYYKMNLTSIYTYLEKRFGVASYKTGSAFFLLSRIIGAAFRLYLVALVMHEFILIHYGLSFLTTVAITIALIWIYTFRGGIQTIVWTDSFQTFCMLSAVILTIFSINQTFDWNIEEMAAQIKQSDYSQIFYFEEGWSEPKNFFKQFLGGASIALVMTGLDQDMMQKNLSCRNIKDAQKNMFWFSIVLVIAKFLFLCLGALLFLFVIKNNIVIPNKSDLLYPTIALHHLGSFTGIVFLVGLVAAAYSSADSALTSLTTAVCVDFLNFEKSIKTEDEKKQLRYLVHISISIALFIAIYIFYWLNDEAVISSIFKAAGYTYGPLLGMYAFGFMTEKKVKDNWVPIICVMAPILTYVLNQHSETIFFGYKFSFELLLLNGLITFLGMSLFSSRAAKLDVT